MNRDWVATPPPSSCTVLMNEHAHARTHTHSRTHAHMHQRLTIHLLPHLKNLDGSSEKARNYLLLRATHRIKQEKCLPWSCLSERKWGISWERINSFKLNRIPDFLQPGQSCLFSREGSISQAYFKCSGWSQGPGNLRHPPPPPAEVWFGIGFIMQLLSSGHLYFSICEMGRRPVLSATVTPLKFLSLWEHIDRELWASGDLPWGKLIDGT